jgi:hypothetical protein
MPRDPAAPTPLPGELRRALEQLRADVGANADGVRRMGHTQRWHGERLDRLEQDGPRTVTASVTTATVQEQPYRGIDIGRFGEDTQTLLLKVVDKALEEKRAKDALKTVDNFRGLGSHVVRTLVTAFALAIAALLVGLLIAQAVRTGGSVIPGGGHG